MADKGFTPYVTKRWHILIGCTALSTGCRACWAAFQVHRQMLSGQGSLYRGLTTIGRHGYQWTGKVRKDWSRLDEPLHYEGQIVWVAPQSDPFHEQISDKEIADYFTIIARSSKNRFLLLTKRIERMHQLYTSGWLKTQIEKNLGHPITWPLPNTWEATSIEDQKAADHRLPLLVDTPSRCRAISAQPLLGRVNVEDHLVEKDVSWAVIGGEAGPMGEPHKVPPDAFFNLQAQFRRLNVPYLMSCYPV